MALKKQHFAEGEIAIFDEAIKLQLLSLRYLRAEDISASSTCYGGITLLSLEESSVSTFNSIRNIEALLLLEAAALEFQHPTTAEETPSFQSLNIVAAVEQYKNINKLLHIQKIARD